VSADEEDTLRALVLGMRVRADADCAFLPVLNSLLSRELINIGGDGKGAAAAIYAVRPRSVGLVFKENINAAFTWLAARNPKAVCSGT
jgi:hypothetical protein